jgi:IS30 family transposase
MLAQSMTENEIAEKLNVDQSTISRDIKASKNYCSNLYLI